MGELALVGDHSTVPLTRVSCNTVFSKSQKTRKAGTLCNMATSGVQFSHPLGMGGEQEVFGMKITLERDDDGLKSAAAH